MARKFLRRLLRAVASLMLLALLVFLGVALLLPKDKLRDEIVSALTEQTGADVTLGKASVRLLPRLGVTLAAGRITGTGEALARRTGSVSEIDDYDVVLDDLVIEVAPRPLLKGRLEVKAVRLVGPSVRVSWSGGQTTVRDYDLAVRDLSLTFAAARASAEEPTEADGEPVPPGERIPEDLVCSFEGSLGEIVLQEAAYDHVAFAGELDTRLLTVTEIVAGRGGGRLRGALEIDYDRDPWGLLDYEVEAVDVPAGALLEPWVPAVGRRLDCDLAGHASGTCRLGGVDDVLATLDMTGRLGGSAGVLRAEDWLRDVLPYLGRRQDLRNVRFDRLEHGFRIEQSRYLVQELEIDGQETDWRGDGWIGLRGDIDLALQVKLPPGFTPELGQLGFLAEALRDQDGRINLDLRLTGRSARPKVDVDLSKLQQAAAQESTSALQKGLGGLLDKWKSR